MEARILNAIADALACNDADRIRQVASELDAREGDTFIRSMRRLAAEAAIHAELLAEMQAAYLPAADA